MRICTLKRSAEFQRVRGGTRWSGPGFLIEGKARSEKPPTADSARAAGGVSCAGPRFGFTVTRKLGGAVTRNRIRRRLRECLRLLPDATAAMDFDYVVVARSPAEARTFDDLGRDFQRAFAHMHRRSRERRPD